MKGNKQNGDNMLWFENEEEGGILYIYMQYANQLETIKRREMHGLILLMISFRLKHVLTIMSEGLLRDISLINC
jgi:hypothetical protein